MVKPTAAAAAAEEEEEEEERSSSSTTSPVINCTLQSRRQGVLCGWVQVTRDCWHGRVPLKLLAACKLCLYHHVWDDAGGWGPAARGAAAAAAGHCCS
jgi:hypothetical protein